MSSPDKKSSDSIVNNEDVVNELTKELKSHLVTNSVDDSPSSTSESNEAYVINADEFSHPDFKINSTTTKTHTMPNDFDKDENSDSDYDSDECETALKDAEVDLSAEQKQERQTLAEKHKIDGNDKFKAGDYDDSIVYYSKGLKICPLIYKKHRAVLYCNRAASRMKIGKHKEAIKDCNKAIENDASYIKAYYRRAQCYESTDAFDESLADFKKILELEPQHPEAQKAIHRLPPLIEERNERLKTEMMSKLKDLGNLVLKPFGLSTENFKLTQDPETKGYSVNFQQNN